MKTKRTSGVIIASRSTNLSEPARRFLRGLLVLILALDSLIALSARGQGNYRGAHYFTTFAGAAIGCDGTPNEWSSPDLVGVGSNRIQNK